MPPNVFSSSNDGFRTWAYFPLLALANTLLAYAPLGIEAKLWVFLGGVLLPLAWAFRTLREHHQGGIGPWPQEALGTPPRWAWVSMLALATAVRLYQTVVPGNWPTWDDGRFAYYSLELLNRWRWTFFFSPTQHPPLFNWLLALFYRLVPPSLTALWLYPALCSIAALFLFGWTARRLLPSSPAFLLTALMAFGFGPLYAGRFCMYMSTLVFWECLTLAVLAYGIKADSPGKERMGLALLGLCAAAGFWVSISWPVVALSVGAAVWAWRKRRTGRDDSLFLVPVLVSALLYAWVSIRFGNGIHIRQLWWGGGSEDFLRRLLDSASNLTVLFWGCDLQNSYGPVWGGVLDPLEGACFFLGALECWRWRRRSWAPALAASFVLLLLPGLATTNFDLFRNTQALPLLLGVTALGACSMLLSLPRRFRPAVLVLFLVFSAFLDLRQLALTYRPDAAGSNRPSSLQMARAFPILKETARRNGPGVLLFELRPHVADQTLAVATYAFNAEVNPRIPLDRVKWMALVVDVHLRPFLEKRFPAGKWFDLFDPVAPSRVEKNWMLGVIPVEASRRKTLEAWVRADKKLGKVVWLAANLPEDGTRAPVFRALPEIHPAFQGDPLLESVYWSAVYDFHRWENLYGDKDWRVHYPAALHAVRQELKLGYPTAYFYNELGAFLAMQNNDAGARKAFQKAVHCPVNFTAAKENLAALGAGKRTKK